MRAPRKDSESGIYHAISKGTGGQIIFEDDEDRETFLALLKAGLKRTSGTLLAWCLMDNHVHLLLSMPKDDLSNCMRRVLSAYAQGFNRKHRRSGYLFQDRFMSEPVEDDEYLLTAIRYIHQNPVRAKMAQTCEYRWSSYGEYCGTPWISSTDMVMDLFDGLEQFVSFHLIYDESDEILDVMNPRRRMTDDEALELALDLIGNSGLGAIKALPRDERDVLLRKLKGHGCTVRQIQRLTGVSLGSISKA